MHNKDLISRHLLKRIALDIARILLHLQVDDIELLEPDEAEALETQQTRVEDRRADLVVKVRSQEGDYLLHLESQNDNRPLMPWRMLRYRADIRFAYPGLPIRQYLLYIGRARLTMGDGIDETGLQYRYTLIDMHDLDVSVLLEQEQPDAWVLAILCDFGGRGERDVVRQILRRLLEEAGADEARFRDYLVMLEVLASNRDLQELVSNSQFRIFHGFCTIGMGISKPSSMNIMRCCQLSKHI